MDGNNRWSLKKKISKYQSYKTGANNILKIAEYIFSSTNIKYISCFALSVNNLKREKKILNILFRVLKDFLNDKTIKKTNFDIEFIGDISILPLDIKKNVKIYNKDNHKKKLIVYFNYGGVEDIKKTALAYKLNKNKKFNYDNFVSTKNLPDPEILIRTGGFNRLSNFNLYQLAFTEMFFLKKLWPDFSIRDLKNIINKFNMIERKFGT